MSERRIFLKQLLAATIYCTFPSLLFARNNTNLLFAPQNVFPLSSKPQRILSAGRVSDVLLMVLCPEKLIGSATEINEMRKRYLSPQIARIPFTGRFAGRGSTVPLEKIVAWAPDIIIDAGAVSDTYLSTAERVYRQTNIPYVIVSGRLADTPQQFLQLGSVLGVEKRAAELATLAAEILDLTHNICGGKNLTAYLGRSADGLETGLPGSIHTEVIEWLGIQNAAAGVGKDLQIRTSPEQLLMWQPDVILTQDRNFFQYLQTATTWQRLKAVQNQRYYLAPDEPFGWLDMPPSVHRLAGCLWLAHILAPEKLPKTVFQTKITGFFHLFYDYDLPADKQFAAAEKHCDFRPHFFAFSPLEQYGV